jgi:hypothetical protein
MKTVWLTRLVLMLGMTIILLGGTHVFSDDTQDTNTRETAMTQTTDVESPSYSGRIYIELVKKYSVDDGEKVDYEAWKNNATDLELLDQQVAMIARVSPDSHPALFPTPATQRSYWINSYNTLILHAVLEYWPLESVRDIKISISSRVVPGKGFFYDRKIVVGGKDTNLYQLEKEMLRNQKDPRLHFALNCGSESCPVLRAWEWNEEQLDTAARAFINNPQNVTVENDKLYLSKIFKWYKKDFPRDIPAYLQQYAEPGLARQLQTAKDGKYRKLYQTYDWSLNAEDTTLGQSH